MRVLAIIREKMQSRTKDARDSFEKYLSSVYDIVWKILTAKKDREKVKEGTRIKAGCFLHSSLRHFLLFFFFRHNELTVSWVPWRHENCSAKIRYNHCRRTRSETDSLRTSRERTAGNPSGGAYFFFLIFTLKIFYRIIQGKVCARLLSGVHSLREISTLMLRIISLT